MATQSELCSRVPVEIYTAGPAAPDTWTRRGAVLACVVADRETKGRYLRGFDRADSTATVLNAELYYSAETSQGGQYSVLSPTFHALELDDCILGLSFESAENARALQSAVARFAPSLADIEELSGVTSAALAAAAVAEAQAAAAPSSVGGKAGRVFGRWLGDGGGGASAAPVPVPRVISDIIPGSFQRECVRLCL